MGSVLPHLWVYQRVLLLAHLKRWQFLQVGLY
uniref:Uncharacterized protein n=1 Tax=Siphoviridae sp. ctr8v12 TaxID=2825685 RepID=A0A8S5QGN5_9CAUD|nr:MAG TPA: hypothetical protein [Siphoviridae sp. ctr8v12]